MKLSVIVASHNRAESLLNFLREIELQIVPNGTQWEVLVVDNNSSEKTRALIAASLQPNSPRIRYLSEVRPGKSLALNTGIRQASGDVLVFTDDDCIPDPHWLANIACQFASDPSLGALGGRVELFDKRDRPVSIRSFPNKTPISFRDQVFTYLIGANMAIRRRVFDVIGFFDPFLGPGTKAHAMEDLDLLYRVFKKKFTMVYSPEALVYHNHGRTTETQIRELNYRYAMSRGTFYCKHILSGDRDVLKMAYWEVSALTGSFFKYLFDGKDIAEQRRLLWALFVGATLRLTWNPAVRKA